MKIPLGLVVLLKQFSSDLSEQKASIKSAAKSLFNPRDPLLNRQQRHIETSSCCCSIPTCIIL